MTYLVVGILRPMQQLKLWSSRHSQRLTLMCVLTITIEADNWLGEARYGPRRPELYTEWNSKYGARGAAIDKMLPRTLMNRMMQGRLPLRFREARLDTTSSAHYHGLVQLQVGTMGSLLSSNGARGLPRAAPFVATIPAPAGSC